MDDENARLERSDPVRDRLVAAAWGLALGVVWVVGLVTGATTWLTWMAALGSLGCFGTVALVPEGRSGFIAAGNLGFIAVGLLACWIVAWVTGATAWLGWSCFAAALLIFVSAMRTALLAVFHHG